MATIQNALGLLNLFSQGRPEIGLTQFKDLSGYDKGTTFRYLNALKSIGFLEQNDVTKAYRLGPAIMRLASIREQTFPIARIAAIYVEKLAHDTGELAHASLLSGQGMSSLFHRDGGISGTRVGFDSAEILPLHATSSGISMLAFGPQYLLENLAGTELETYTDATETDLETIHETVQMARKNGYAAMSQSYEAEVSSVAVPFFEEMGMAVGSLSVATPRSRMTRQARLRLLACAIEAARSMSTALGAQIPSALNLKWNSIEEEARLS